VLPIAHISNLHDAPPSLLSDIFTVTAQLTAAASALYGTEGSIIFQNNVRPDDALFHLHVHVVPRFPGDHFLMPDAAVTAVPRAERLRQAADMHWVPTALPAQAANGRQLPQQRRPRPMDNRGHAC
jgi:histidine triad (HIT) family protein